MHVFRLGKPWPQAQNLTELQTFALHATDVWVEVTVDAASPDVFSVSKQQS